jgi:DNA polymerase III delta prime subunit
VYIYSPGQHHAQVLQQVAAAEDCPLSPDAAASIAGLSDGDVRNAILTLQTMFAGHRVRVSEQKCQ